MRESYGKCMSDFIIWYSCPPVCSLLFVRGTASAHIWVRVFCGVSFFIILKQLTDFHDPSVDMIMESASVNKHFHF